MRVKDLMNKALNEDPNKIITFSTVVSKSNKYKKNELILVMLN